MQTYDESLLSKDGHYIGGKGSAYLEFLPKHVIWEAIGDAAVVAHIRQLLADVDSWSSRHV